MPLCMDKHCSECILKKKESSVEKRSHTTKRKGSFVTEGQMRDPGGEEKREGVCPTSGFGWKNINILEGTSQTSASLFVFGDLVEYNQQLSAHMAMSFAVLTREWSQTWRPWAFLEQIISMPIFQGVSRKSLWWKSQLSWPVQGPDSSATVLCCRVQVTQMLTNRVLKTRHAVLPNEHFKKERWGGSHFILHSVIPCWIRVWV